MQPEYSSYDLIAGRAKARRNAWLLGLVAIGFFVAFIVMSIVRAHKT
jgi:hypothetical protein